MKDLDKELKKIPVRIVSPDGDECYVSSIDKIDQYEEVKSFIRQREKELLKEIVENYGDDYNDGCGCCMEDLLKTTLISDYKIKELKKEVK